MRPQRIWLIRHGETQWNSEQRFCGSSDVPLTTLGRAQARWLARRLSSEALSAIYSSDLLRARQTADIITQSLSLSVPIRVAATWREINFGAWEGMTYAQIARQYPQELDFFTDPLKHAPPGGESLQELVKRVQTGWDDILRSETARSNGNIALVSHGGPLCALLCCILGMPLERRWQLRLAPGSLSAVDVVAAATEAMPVATLTLFNEQRPMRSKPVASS